MAKKIILHVGLGKTGTTFLQKKIFPYLNNVFDLNNGDKSFSEEPFSDLQYINDCHTARLNYNTLCDQNYLIEYSKKINCFINSNVEEDNVLISSEGFSASCWTHFNCNYKNAEILKEIFPDAKIFFIFRKQPEWFESYYKQVFLKDKSYADFINISELLGFKDGKFDKGNKLLNVYEPSWLSMVEFYIEKFGHENVLALPYEMFLESPNNFLKTFYDFMSIDEFYPEKYEFINKSKNKAYKINALKEKYRKFQNKLPRTLKKIVRFADCIILPPLSAFTRVISKDEFKLSENQKQIIFEIQKDNNQKLSELISINLDQYGYY